MRSGYEMDLIGRSFEEARRNDHILRALIKITAGMELKTEDYDALQGGIEFLESVRKGSSQKVINTDSSICAFHFEKAHRSWRTVKHETDDNFLKDVDAMLETTKDILAKKRPDTNRILEVRKFFGSIFRGSVAELDRMIVPDALA